MTTSLAHMLKIKQYHQFWCVFGRNSSTVYFGCIPIYFELGHLVGNIFQRWIMKPVCHRNSQKANGIKSGPDLCHWLLRSPVVAFANLDLRNWWRSLTLLLSVLLDCSIRGQLFLRTIAFDHPRLIRSNLICRRCARMRCRWRTDPSTQLDANVRPHNSTAHLFQVINASNVQICSVCAKNPWLGRPSRDAGITSFTR